MVTCMDEVTGENTDRHGWEEHGNSRKRGISNVALVEKTLMQQSASGEADFFGIQKTITES